MRFHYSALIIAATLSVLLFGCNQENSNTMAIERNQNGEITIIRPQYLSAEEALDLSERLRSRGRSKNIIGILRFTHYFKRAQKEPAVVALEHVEHKLAEAIVASVKERRKLDSQVVDIYLQEGLELRNELESITECEREVAAGRFVPLTGKQFCVVWDSGILELLPSPSKMLTGAARAAAARSVAKLPREQLRKIPKISTVMTRYESRRVVLQEGISVRLQREDELAKQLVNLTWNVMTGLSSPN